MATISVERDGYVLLIGLDRPEKTAGPVDGAVTLRV